MQIASNNPLGRISVNQTIEVTVNKDTQTPGGTTGFSLKAGAIKRYYITAEYRSAFLIQLRYMVQGNRLDMFSAVVEILQGWVNPFSDKQDLISISTAKTAQKDITSNLKKAHEIGE